MAAHKRLRNMNAAGAATAAPGAGASPHAQDCSICLNAIAVSPERLWAPLWAFVANYSRSPASLFSLLLAATLGITSAFASC
jgi:hypothetical protein